MITYNIFHTLDIFQRNLLLFEMYKMECSGGAPGMLNTESQNINMLKPPATPKNPGLLLCKPVLSLLSHELL